TKMSSEPLVSWGTRLVADDVKTTNRPRALSAGGPVSPLVALVWVPSLATLTRSVPARSAAAGPAEPTTTNPAIATTSSPRRALIALVPLPVSHGISVSPWSQGGIAEPGRHRPGSSTQLIDRGGEDPKVTHNTTSSGVSLTGYFDLCLAV